MRLEIPDEIPRRRIERPHPPAPPLEPSPLERHRESLAEQAANPRTLNLPRKPRKPIEPERQPVIDRPRLTHDHPTVQRPRRHTLPSVAIGLQLRDEERKILSDVGRFRVVRTEDLAKDVYAGRTSRMMRDLANLQKQGLVKMDSVNARRDGRGGKVEQIEVVTLTDEERRIAHLASGLPVDQVLYSGLVKLREAEHDTLIYRAWSKERERIERDGGTNLRVKLDFELKSEVQKAIHAARRADPERDMVEIKQDVARQFDLPFVNDGIQISDARIEYDLA